MYVLFLIIYIYFLNIPFFTDTVNQYLKKMSKMFVIYLQRILKIIVNNLQLNLPARIKYFKYY